MSECYSDHLDYCDIEDVKSYQEDDLLSKKGFNDEIWKNINRRAEKAKMVSLSSMQLREIKDLMMDIIKKIGVK